MPHALEVALEICLGTLPSPYSAPEYCLRLSPGGTAHLHGSVTNLFNSQPPVDLETYGGGALYRDSTLDQDGAVGRFFLLGATLTF
jgi:hypothetical protein